MRTRCKATLSSLSRNNSPLPTLLHLYNSPTPTPPIQPCAENKCTLTIGTISILIVIIPIVESEEEGGRFSCLPDARFASGATVDANPRYLRTRRDRFFLLSLSLSPLVLLLCCETGEKLGVVEDARERIARFVTSIRGPKACCATLRRLPSSLGITVRVFSPPTGHRHGPSGVSIDRARPKLSPNRSIRCVPS